MTPDNDTEWTAAWEQMLGSVPSLATDLREMAPVAEEGYRKLRQWIYSDHADGLPRATKELIMVVINVAEGNPAGAVTHLKLGARNGLTQVQLSEALAQCFLSLGLIRFNVAGIPAWNAFKEVPAEPPAGR
jgi:AhpD family alkylhydroperoxidase